MNMTFRELLQPQVSKRLLSLGIKSLENKLRSDRMERKHRPFCGAKTRRGTPCKAKVYWPCAWDAPAKRCRMHGGLSTGPTTEEGMERLAKAAKENMKRIWRERREGTRPMPRKWKVELPDLELILDPNELTALGEITLELPKEDIFLGPL